ncbi:DUF6284 family protein [Streptomyces sp. NPDC039016]|uniref:DUF6284 family protein n=1 Tax=Streptomyces sp. NPDC039016 TaxID=3154330 RepID=UPI0033E2E8CC
MSTIIALAPDADRDPTAAELDAIAAEETLISAEVDLLDVQIALLDCTLSEMDQRRLRRARSRVLAERLALANRTVGRGVAA